VTFTAALPPRNTATLERLLAAAADPTSPQYGQWLSQTEVNELTAPEPAVRKQVHTWLARGGAKCVDWPTSLRCTASVRSVESLLNTKMTAFHHTAKDKVIHRVHPNQGWTFPAHLSEKLMFITNLADFPTQRRRNGAVRAFTEPGSPQDTDYIVVVETLRHLYNFESLGPADGDVRSSGAPAEFQADQSWSEDDLKQFAQQNGVALWNVTHKVRAGLQAASRCVSAVLSCAVRCSGRVSL
jgi:tripeptidyl-peptidase-1